MNPQPMKISASAWFSSAYADQYFVREQSVKCGHRGILTILLYPDRQMIEYY